MTREFLGFRKRNFQDIVFIRTKTSREIFKYALVHSLFTVNEINVLLIKVLTVNVIC